MSCSNTALSATMLVETVDQSQCLFVFVFNCREEKDAFVDENDILNSDSFVSGIIFFFFFFF